MKNLKTRILVILAVVIASIFFAFPIEKRINLGLDLKGGMHLILKVETEKLDDKAKSDAVLRAIEILRNRIDSLGAGETVIQRQGENQILVQLPGITDRKKAIDLIGRVAQLEFRLVSDNPTMLQQAIESKTAPKGYVLKSIKKEGGAPILLEDKIALSGETVSDAFVNFDSTGFGQPQISLKFNGQGARQFGELTKNNVGHRLAIILDDEVLSAPNINEAILGGEAQITGQFTFEEASLLSLALRSGALPAPMHVEEERTIGPLLGQDSIEAGIRATVLGGLLIVGFMSLYYFVGGIIASIALVANLLMILGGMGLLNILMPESRVTLTLPGIAGIILTLGMAVDANVLINERIREEVENGHPLVTAINSGYKRAWAAILDSHVTSLIAAFMLFQFGSGPIKGFAVTLTVGLLASLFTSIFITKTLSAVLTSNGWIKSLPMMHIFTKPNFNFLNKKYICFVISAVLLVWGISSLISKKDAAYGIDFAGGQVQEFKFEKPVSTDDFRAMFKKADMPDIVIQDFENAPNNIMLRTPEDTHEQVVALFKEKMPDNSFELLRIEKVGPVVGKALRAKAMYAIIFALLGMLVYVGLRFKHYDFALAAVIAIFHDVVITLGLIVIMGRQIDLLVVTALMTIAGYSINDSIIIYDRVRENVVKARNKPLGELINDSINQTLGRTILTTFVTLLSVFALYFVGGEVLNTFALVLIIGFLFGTYSTVYIVSPLFLMWHGNKKW